jgi:aminopeptidase N
VFELSVTAPPPWRVTGNGIARPHGPGRWRLAPTPPMSSYLVTVIAGPYYQLVTEHRGVPFGLHCRRSLAGALDRDAAELLDVTRACFDRYLEIFDEPYPYDSYDQAFVPELGAGAMENPGCVTFRDEFISGSALTLADRQTRAMVIAHEMAHMWFGDLVTMRWWDDVWLSESFATYLGFQVLADATGFAAIWTDFALARKTRGYDADQRASAHPVAPGPLDVRDTDTALASYDDISYAKGAAVLRQLVAWLGWPVFQAGLNEYVARHKFGNATLTDLLDSLAAASGQDVHGWAGRWLRTAGADTLAVRRDDDGARLGHDGHRSHLVLVGAYDHDPAVPGALVLRGRYPVPVTAGAAQAVIPAEAAWPPPALLLPNDGDLTYARIRLDPQSWATVAAALRGLPDSLSRAVAWNAARDLVRAGELPADAYLDLVAAHLPAETDTCIVAAVLDFARGQVADRYLPAARRPAALRRIAAACRDLLRRANHGDADGLALAAARGLIASATDPADLGGLSPDLAAGLRWPLLLRRTVLGAAGPADIDQAAAADATAAGREGAARCRAAAGAPEAKAAAWALLFAPGGPARPSSNALAATAQGFWQAEQAGLLAGYLPRYFPALAELAARRGPGPARLLVRHGFPWYAVDAATLDGVTAAAATAGLDPALRRLLADEADDLRRALAVTAAG